MVHLRLHVRGVTITLVPRTARGVTARRPPVLLSDVVSGAASEGEDGEWAGDSTGPAADGAEDLAGVQVTSTDASRTSLLSFSGVGEVDRWGSIAITGVSLPQQTTNGSTYCMGR